MKFEIEQQVLMAALKRIKGCVNEGHSVPVLRNMWIEVKDGGVLSLRGNDLDKEIRIDVDLTIDGWEPGLTTVEYRYFEAYCSKHPKTSTLKIALKDRTLKVACGRGSSSLLTLAHDDYPDLGVMPDGRATFMLPANDLKKLLSKVQIAMSTETTRYYLNGVFLHHVEVDGVQMLRAVATDGHRLGYQQVPAPEGSEKMPGVILPRSAIREVLDMCEPDLVLEVEVSVSKVILQSTGIKFITKLIDGVFPDYSRVIPKGNDKRAVVDRKEVITMVDRVATVGSERGRAVKFSFDEGKLTLTANNPDGGFAQDESQAEFSDEGLAIGFNHAYVESILESIEADNVEIHLADPGSPTLFRVPGDETCLFVLMPMRA